VARVAAAYVHPDRWHVHAAATPAARCVGRRGARRERGAALSEGLPRALRQLTEEEAGKLRLVRVPARVRVPGRVPGRVRVPGRG